jgi:hypothetical protein
MENQLVIVIDYETPPRAEDIGALFSALAKDYKTVSRGRVLVVASINHGSIIATLIDWAFQALPYVKGSVEVAKGAKALADFSKLLRDGIAAVKSPKSVKLPQPSGGKRSVHRSVKALVKMAAENGCNIRIKHTDADGETLEVEMTAPEANEAQVILDAPKAIQAPKAIDRQMRAVQLPEVREAISKLYAPDAGDSTEGIDALIDSLFEVLQAVGLTNLIPQIATDLAQKGLHTLAAALEAKMHRQDGKPEPPLNTT